MSLKRMVPWVAALCFVSTGFADNHETGDVSKGKQAFEGRCLMCHFDDKADKKIGPGLAGIKDGKLPSGKEATRANILENMNKGGNGMPAFEQMLSEEEKINIAAYVLSL